jgi:hypothetical protein
MLLNCLRWVWSVCGVGSFRWSPLLNLPALSLVVQSCLQLCPGEEKCTHVLDLAREDDASTHFLCSPFTKHRNDVWHKANFLVSSLTSLVGLCLWSENKCVLVWIRALFQCTILTHVNSAGVHIWSRSACGLRIGNQTLTIITSSSNSLSGKASLQLRLSNEQLPVSTSTHCLADPHLNS